MDVQQRHLRTFATQLKDDPQVPASTLLAMGRLEAALEARQEGFRHGFGERFSAFSADAIQSDFRDLFGSGGPW
jgi:hypothetical protein